MSTQTSPLQQATLYERWNSALACWATQGSPEGTGLYFSVDERALLTVARQFAGLECRGSAEACQSFCQAVTDRCVRDGRIDLSGLSGTAGGYPRSVAFLAAMVFAAYQMVDDEKADDNAYFVRLRELFRVEKAANGFRPRGLEPHGQVRAPEEPLWREWNQWLERRGYLPTASQGAGPKCKYSNYPISQAILRRGDRVRLARWFREQVRDARLTRLCDRDLLAVRLPELGQSLGSARLRNLLQDTDDYRHFEALIDAAAEVYDAIDWDQPHDGSDLDLSGPRRLIAGLYRTENFITGTAEYRLYPKTPRRWQGAALSVQHDGGSHILREQRPGWFMPLWSVELGADHTYPVTGTDDITALILPRREFWLLMHDPDDEASGVLATWGIPAPGQTFLLLCQEKHERQLRILKEEGLLTWERAERLGDQAHSWIEYRECQVQSSRWKRVMPQPDCEDLLEALRPTRRVNIALEGGLRVPGQPVWIEGHQPALKLYQFGGAVTVRIWEVSAPDQMVVERTVAANEPVELPCLRAGEYLLEAKEGEGVALRRLRIAGWEQLAARVPVRDFSTRVNGFWLRGASLSPAGEERR